MLILLFTIFSPLSLYFVTASSSTACTDSSALYVLPASGANIDSARQTTISWNSACLNSTSEIDIYLYAPLQPSASLPIHAWTHVPVSVGSYAVKLAPKWWNATSSVELSLNIVPTGNQPWDSSFSYGPTWYATYTAPTDGSAPPADAVVGTSGNNNSSTSDALISIFYKGGHLTKGGMAAAIVVPLIVVFIALAIWIRKLHLNRNNKLADWADHMDKRMSKISLDWTSGGDGAAGPVPGSRPASFIRPQSQYRPSVEAVRAAYNASVAQHGHASTEGGHISESDEMSEVHKVSESIHSTRQSNYRVSFAPSAETSRGLRASSYHQGNRAARTSRLNTEQRFDDDQFEDENENSYVMSPTQEEGATPVRLEALRRSVDESIRQSMLHYPALRMVDGGETEQVENQHEMEQELAAQEALAVAAPAAINEDEISAHTGMAPPAHSDSPDAALKQYAALRAAAGGHSPSPLSTDGSKMRNLYGASPVPFVGQHKAQQESIATGAGSSINEDDVVGYNQMIDGQTSH